jgi:hypothetical protein
MVANIDMGKPSLAPTAKIRGHVEPNTSRAFD